MNKNIISILVAVMIVLAGGLGVMAKDALDKKANNETIMKVIVQMKEQRIEDRQFSKEQRIEDRAEQKEYREQRDSIDTRTLESIEMLLIKMVDKK